MTKTETWFVHYNELQALRIARIAVLRSFKAGTKEYAKALTDVLKSNDAIKNWIDKKY